MLEFADIAWPVVLPEEWDDIWRETEAMLVIFGSELAQEMIRDMLDIF